MDGSGPRINASNRPPWVVGVPIVRTPVAIEPICRALTSLAFVAGTVLVAVLDMGWALKHQGMKEQSIYLVSH